MTSIFPMTLSKYLAAIAVFVAASLASHAQTRPPATLTPTVVSGKDTRVGFFYALNPDCSSRGEGDTRLIKKPEHGTVEFTFGEGNPNYPENSQWFHCNKKKVPGTLVMYKSSDGYAGKEYFDIEFIGPFGADLISRYIVTVK